MLDLAGLESALAQTRATFEGRELHPTMIEKASALGFSLIRNHPFVDGNKRTGHAAMEAFLVLNGHEISATVDEQERVILEVASGDASREEFTRWRQGHVVPRMGRE
jgi:death on curing protein